MRQPADCSVAMRSNIGLLVQARKSKLSLIRGSGDLVRGYFPKGPSTFESNTLRNIELHNYFTQPKYPIIGSFGPRGFYRVTSIRKGEPI